MMSFRNLSIRRKLILAQVATSAVPLLIAVALALGYEVANQRVRAVRDLSAQAEMIAVSTRATLDFDDPKRATETLATLAGRPEILAACLYTAQGKVFASYVRSTEGAFRFPELREAGHLFHGDYLDLFRPIGEGSDTAGHVYLRTDMRTLYAGLARFVAIVVGTLIVLVGVSFWLSRLAQRFISRPILELAESAQLIRATRNYSVRVPKRGDDEIGQLTEAFNEMLVGIEERDAALQRRTNELEAANKDMEAFSYSVSHDLRTPLRGMDGFSQALLEDYASQLDSTGQDYLRRIRDAAQRMGHLIDDMLNLSRVTRSEMTFDSVDLGALARKVIAELQPQQAGRVVEWKVRNPLRARGDARLLGLVLENLLANALKFTGKREQARIEFGEVVGEAERAFFVRDNGAGFDMAHAGRLFGAFQRLHSAQEFPGTGIGLATVQRIIRRHGGRVWAEGQPENGATFYFTLSAISGDPS